MHTSLGYRPGPRARPESDEIFMSRGATSSCRRGRRSDARGGRMPQWGHHPAVGPGAPGPPRPGREPGPTGRAAHDPQATKKWPRSWRPVLLSTCDESGPCPSRSRATDSEFEAPGGSTGRS
jgi:hypothetical protein